MATEVSLSANRIIERRKKASDRWLYLILFILRGLAAIGRRVKKQSAGKNGKKMLTRKYSHTMFSRRYTFYTFNPPFVGVATLWKLLFYIIRPNFY